MEAELREARSKMEAQMAAEKRKMEEQMLAMKQAAAEEMQQQKVRRGCGFPLLDLMLCATMATNHLQQPHSCAPRILYCVPHFSRTAKKKKKTG